MTNQDDILQHYKYKGRRKSKNVIKRGKTAGVTDPVLTPGDTVIQREESERIKKGLRRIDREARADANRKFQEVRNALKSKGGSFKRTDRIARAIEAYREAKDYHEGRITDSGGEAVHAKLKELAEAKKANDRSRQQHGEVKVRSYRRNGKIVRGYKRARRSSKKR